MNSENKSFVLPAQKKIIKTSDFDAKFRLFRQAKHVFFRQHASAQNRRFSVLGKNTASISTYQSWEIERDRTAVGQKEKIEEEKEKCRKVKKKTEVRSKKEEKTKEGQGHIKEEVEDISRKGRTT